MFYSRIDRRQCCLRTRTLVCQIFFQLGPSCFVWVPQSYNGVWVWTKIKAPHLLQSWLASPLHENNQRGVTSCGILVKFKFVWGQTQQSSTFAHHFPPSLAGVGVAQKCRTLLSPTVHSQATQALLGRAVQVLSKARWGEGGGGVLGRAWWFWTIP